MWNAPVEPLDENGERGALDLLIVVAGGKKTIAAVTLAAAVLAACLSLLMTNIYTATTKILPPQQGQSVAGAMASQLGPLAGMASRAMDFRNLSNLYIAMLQSRTVMEKIAVRFGLQQQYGQQTMAGTIRVLARGTSMTASKEGLVTVEVDDRDPKRAADLANAFIEELNAMLQEFAVTDASRKRVFFDQQMRQAKDALTNAEMAVDRTPNTSLQYLSAVRNLKYQESVYEILARQFESAKLDEAKDFPLIQVLDRGVPPERKAKPHRAIIVLGVALLAFVLAVAWVLARERYLRAQRHPEYAARLAKLRGLLWNRKKGQAHAG